MIFLSGHPSDPELQLRNSSQHICTSFAAKTCGLSQSGDAYSPYRRVTLDICKVKEFISPFVSCKHADSLTTIEHYSSPLQTSETVKICKLFKLRIHSITAFQKFKNYPQTSQNTEEAWSCLLQHLKNYTQVSNTLGHKALLAHDLVYHANQSYGLHASISNPFPTLSMIRPERFRNAFSSHEGDLLRPLPL